MGFLKSCEAQVYRPFTQHNYFMSVCLAVLTLFGWGFSYNTAKDVSLNNQDQRHTRNDRQVIVEELKRIKSLVESGNKEKIASLFDFPVPDSVCNPYIDNEKFDIEYQENGNKLSKAMFYKYYKEIFTSLRIWDLQHLFHNINLNELSQKDEAGYKKVIATQPCYRMYSIQIKGDQVNLYTGSTWNEDYKDKSKPTLEGGKYYNEFCAHTTWWTFRLDGKRLRLINIGEVG